MLWKGIKKLTYRTHIVVYLLLLAFIPMITLGGYSYYTYVQHITDKVGTSTETTVEQVKSRVDSLLVDIRKNYTEAIERDEVTWFLNNEVDYSNYTQLVDVTNVLQGNRYLVDYISGYTIINFNTGWVLSNRGMYPYDELLNKDEVNRLREGYSNSITRYTWLDHTGESSSSKLKREMVDLRGLSLAIWVPVRSQEPQGLVVINIDQNKIYSILQEFTEGNLTLLNEQGRVVYADHQGIAAYCRENLETLLEDQTVRLQLGGEGSHVATAKNSDAVKWTYVVSADLDIAKEGGNDIIQLMALLMILITLLIIGIKIFASRIYSPVFNLTQYVNRMMEKDVMPLDKEGNTNAQDEFAFLTHSISELVDKKKSLEHLIGNQKVQLTELFQLRLIEGDIRGEQVDAYRIQLSIPKMKYYAILSVKLSMGDFLEGEELVSEGAVEDAMRIEMAKHLPKEMTSQLLMPPIFNYETLSFIVASEDKEALIQKAIYAFRTFETYINQKNQFFISCGVSNIFEHLIDYRKAYYESVEAMKQHSMGQAHAITSRDLVFYGDIEAIQAYSYNVMLEKQVVEAVDCGNEEEAFRLVDQFINELMASRVRPNDYQMYLHRFLLALLTVMVDQGLATDSIFRSEDESIFLSFAKIYEANKLKTFYRTQIIRPIITELAGYRESQSGSIMEAIRLLIQESHGDITLNECAQKLHYHPTYIWKVMKLEGEVTFSDFVAEYKLTEAKRLLDESKLTVTEIAQKLGYTNTQNFIRFFSKVEGVTPGKYRKRKDDMETIA